MAGAVFRDIRYLFERSAHELCIFSYKMRLSSAKDILGEQAGLWTGGCMVGSLNSDHFRIFSDDSMMLGLAAYWNGRFMCFFFF